MIMCVCVRESFLPQDYMIASSSPPPSPHFFVCRTCVGWVVYNCAQVQSGLIDCSTDDARDICRYLGNRQLLRSSRSGYAIGRGRSYRGMCGVVCVCVLYPRFVYFDFFYPEGEGRHEVSGRFEALMSGRQESQKGDVSAWGRTSWSQNMIRLLPQNAPTRQIYTGRPGLAAHTCLT